MMSRPTLAAALLLLCLPGVRTAPQGLAASAAPPPAEYEANPNIGPGGDTFLDSGHFRIYGNSGAEAEQALAMLEAAHDCFITDLGWRSSGLSFNAGGDDGPYTKTNVYSVTTLEGAAGVMHSDAATGMAFLEVVQDYLTTAGVTIHEYGHGVHYHQRTWVGQGRTGAWWETFANWFADTYKTSDLCAAAREAHGQATGQTEIDLVKTIGDSFQVLVDGSVGSGNYYQAWPFFTYLTENPDQFSGLGSDAVRQLMIQYEENSNETPLHTLQRVAGDATAASIVGKYWAHMAYVDIGHPQAHEAFLAQRNQLNFNNVQSTGEGTYAPLAGREPLYMGANIIPLQTTGGPVNVEIDATGFTATLAVMAGDSFRYVPVAPSGSAEIAEGEEVTLVIANTPEALVLYDPFALTSEVTQPLQYSFTLSGATAVTSSGSTDFDISKREAQAGMCANAGLFSL